jgi:hypothetical protein
MVVAAKAESGPKGAVPSRLIAILYCMDDFLFAANLTNTFIYGTVTLSSLLVPSVGQK